MTLMLERWWALKAGQMKRFQFRLRTQPQYVGQLDKKTDFLKTKGFIIKTPINMKGTALDRTRVHHQPGSIIEAQNIALLLGLDDQNDVYKMPTDLSAYDGYDEPHVLIALGIDKASAD
jgi:hypothetical protein